MERAERSVRSDARRGTVPDERTAALSTATEQPLLFLATWGTEHTQSAARAMSKEQLLRRIARQRDHGPQQPGAVTAQTRCVFSAHAADESLIHAGQLTKSTRDRYASGGRCRSLNG